MKPWVILGAKLFFRRIEVSGIENFPKNKAVILVANHQNAMLDPVMLCLFLPRQLHWLTRADIFRKPRVNKLLRSLNMLPVYRERDKVDDLHGVNKLTFDECNDRLNGGAVLCVFPEGTHRGKKQLIALKKGVARMTMNAIGNGVRELCIVPVGLDYENYYEYQSSLLIKIGKPINLDCYQNRFTDQIKAQNALMTDIRLALQEVMIDIQHNEAYDATYALEDLCHTLSGHEELSGRFDYFHALVKRVNDDDDVQDQVVELSAPYAKSMQVLQLEEKYYREKGMTSMEWITFFALIPFVIPALIFFYPLYFAIENIVKRIVRDELFKNSIRMCFWTFFMPLWWMLWLVVFVFILKSLWLALFISVGILISGLLALNWFKLVHLYKNASKVAVYRRVQNKEFINFERSRNNVIRWLIKLNLR
ncbi:MAG: 1-acyl-sn-glycerol-3-phosphate acyltransferase [Flavobacteriales bacterium]